MFRDVGDNKPNTVSKPCQDLLMVYLPWQPGRRAEKMIVLSCFSQFYHIFFVSIGQSHHHMMASLLLGQVGNLSHLSMRSRSGK